MGFENAGLTSWIVGAFASSVQEPLEHAGSCASGAQAVRSNNVVLFELLLDHRANPLKKSQMKRTVLHAAAARNRDYECSKILEIDDFPVPRLAIIRLQLN